MKKPTDKRADKRADNYIVYKLTKWLEKRYAAKKKK